ncbi:MAG: hypothetical protein CO031_02715 [Candidatus Nealsonbacteria bacterium CG_4_9_14_0_2_um_filter_37_38]|uniref:Uncharacterized protein n=1 Tax=Candidatus Nealsonbacteria bacterium CG_4_10_14_0_8_um_filter_37_14 TaxID=1974684 RepID=A0A2M7R6R7_9BACT|nr:MAG: hypothetical protein COV63_03530 [Candidatus Nealsonbacteria bacterium CG11_big_fil_rev_8_21_14_0_20_37_68]PIW92163.1 MAG: hypothetical protein COZ89_01300 [Candidatus Nealsonbacteria bacterium CG_4_8_14_3_um_filter_37_23]PIY89017.1 MAG: hypothetical protein COY73_02210 [Candidatus Nealsonbacteria bacterium CG_4_10_14_0_8_um_filter_37_14]PJC51422.1 MAG: hypothetical protein CO031_02715 [Candidatus Nealsonbacteria bacterium CG_4_9_14_0_2_um_filter_37_38]
MENKNLAKPSRGISTCLAILRFSERKPLSKFSYWAKVAEILKIFLWSKKKFKLKQKMTI